MCGIAGIISFSENRDLAQILAGMNKCLAHRGPDANGIWIAPARTVGFAHSRLSILDLTQSGNQPMESHSGRFTIVFNGEIYNHAEIRNYLNSHFSVHWRGTSDTEVLLESIERIGLKATLAKSVGMFAFGLFNRDTQKVILCRDRMGEKPLYYGHCNRDFVFASELSAIKNLPTFSNPVSTDALGLFFQFSSVPEPYSIYEGVFKLGSGELLHYDLKTKDFSIEKYWQLEGNAEKEHYDSPSKAISTLDNLIRSAIGLQMQADVPTGAFLSGGIDSSAVAAVMQSLSSSKIDTFTIGFHEKSYNEAEFAKEVAQQIGSCHHELYVSEKDLLDVVPKLSTVYSEPFSEASQIPTYLLAKLANTKVSVALSGDGGDELFCGYWRYHFTARLWNKINRVPQAPRQILGKVLEKMPYHFWSVLLSPLKFKNPEINFPDKVLKLLPLLRMGSAHELYCKGMMSHNSQIGLLVNGFRHVPTVFDEEISAQSQFEMMMHLDRRTYLPNNNLAKTDRASMAFSLETRTPFMDHRIVRFAEELPLDYMVREQSDKWILKQVLYKYVPASYFNRPKKGFSVPLEKWLRGPLKDWGYTLLNEPKIREENYLNYNTVRRYWDEHQSGKRNWSAPLWDILVFQDWLNKQHSK